MVFDKEIEFQCIWGKIDPAQRRSVLMLRAGAPFQILKR
jgi:hypothetical protein